MPSSRDIRAGGAFVEFSLRKQKLEQSLRAVGKRMQGFGANVAKIGAQFAAIGTAITAPFALAIRQFTQTGDQLDKMSKRTGFSVEALSELRFAAEQSGGGLELLEKGIRSMQRSVNDLGRGLSTQKDAFADLNLTFDDLDGLSPEEQFEKIADQVARIEDPGKRAAVAMQVFGRAGQQLIPLLSGGSKAINELREQARGFGLTIDTETADSAAKLTDAWNVLKKQALVLAVNIGAQLAPALQRVTEIVSRIGVSVIQWAKENGTLIRTVAAVGAGVLGLGSVLIGVGTAAGLAGIAISGLATVAGALLSPFGLIVTAVGVATVALFKFTTLGGQAVEFLRRNFGGLLGFVTETFGAISEAIAAGDIKLAVEILWASVQLAFVQGTAAIREKLTEFKYAAIKAWVEIKAGILSAATTMAAKLASVWLNISAGAKTAWQNVSGDAVEAFNLAKSVAQKGANAIRGFLDSSFDVEAANRQVDDAFVKAQQNAQRLREENNRRIEANNNALQSGLERATQARQDQIASELDNALKSLRGVQEGESQALVDQITKLQQQREAALDKLKGLTPSGGIDADDFAPDLEGLEGALSKVAKSGGSRGVTNSGAIQALQSGTKTGLDKIATLSREQVEQLKQVNRLLLTGGATVV